jgi:hypothetical protein
LRVKECKPSGGGGGGGGGGDIDGRDGGETEGKAYLL